MITRKVALIGAVGAVSLAAACGTIASTDTSAPAQTGASSTTSATGDQPDNWHPKITTCKIDPDLDTMIKVAGTIKNPSGDTADSVVISGALLNASGDKVGEFDAISNNVAANQTVVWSTVASLDGSGFKTCKIVKVDSF